MDEMAAEVSQFNHFEDGNRSGVKKELKRILETIAR